MTSYTELQRDGVAAERQTRLGNDDATPHVTAALTASRGPIVAATDYVRALPELIRAYVPRRYVTLGTDGFGRSDTRQALREFFEVDRASIVIAALKALVDDGAIEATHVRAARERYERAGTSHGAPWQR